MLQADTITKLSQSFGEPEAMQKIRLDAWKEAGHLPRHELRYGLEISIGALPNLEDVVPEKDVVSYKFSENAGHLILSWADAMKDSEIVQLLTKHFTPEHSPVLKNYYFAKALASFTTGIVIVANENAEMSQIDLTTTIEKSGADFVFVMAKRGTTLQLCDTVQSSELDIVFGRTFFVVVEEGARVEIMSIQEASNETTFFANKFSIVERGGSIEWFDFHFGGKLVKSDIEDFLLEEGATSSIRNISLCAGERFDFYNASHHIAPRTVSNISARGIAGTGAKVIYRGLVSIEKNCPGSSGKQEGRFLLAGIGAEIDAIPSLDIQSPEVSCSHALSINHLKDEEFFYPALRGIEPYRAQSLLFSGFLSKGFDGISEEHDLKIRDIIYKKLRSRIFID